MKNRQWMNLRDGQGANIYSRVGNLPVHIVDQHLLLDTVRLK